MKIDATMVKQNGERVTMIPETESDENQLNASSWSEVPLVIDGRTAKYETVAHGISRSICNNEVLVDFGDEFGELATARLNFRDEKTAWAAYSKGIRLAVKVVEHPEHKL